MFPAARFCFFIAVLILAAFVPTDALNFPLFPGTPPALCSVVDFPWYICEQSETFDEEAIPKFYNRVVAFFGTDQAPDDAADPGTRRQLRQASSKQA
jgi:hypothetical protein